MGQTRSTYHKQLRLGKEMPVSSMQQNYQEQIQIKSTMCSFLTTPYPYNVQFFRQTQGNLVPTTLGWQHVGHQLYLKPYPMSNTVLMPHCLSVN